MKKLELKCCFLLFLFLLLLFVKTTFAEKLSSGKTYIIRSAMNNNYVIDVYYMGTANGTNIQLYHYNGVGDSGEGAQKFIISSTGNGYYKIINTNSNKAIDVSGCIAGNGVNVHLWEQNGTDAQLFRFESAGNGLFYIKNKLGYYLDVDNAKCEDWTNIHTWQKNGGNNQKWLLTFADDATFSTQIVTLGNFSTVNEWIRQMKIAESSVMGFKNLYQIYDPNRGSIVFEEGKVIVGIKILSYKTIKIMDPQTSGPLYEIKENNSLRNLRIQLPQRIRFTLHKHNYKSNVYFDFTTLSNTIRCSCGRSYRYEWEFPLPDIKEDKEKVHKVIYRELPR